MKIKKLWLALLTAAVGGVLFLIYEQIKTLTPEAVLVNLFDMDAPARYAFISDQQSPVLAVFDILQGAQTGVLPLQMPARALAVAKNQPLLIYSDGGRDWISHHLATHQETRQTAGYPIEKLKVLDGLLLTRGEKQLTLWQLSPSGAKKMVDFADFTRIHSEVFSPLSETLWLLDEGTEKGSGRAEKRPFLWRYSFLSKKSSRFMLPADWHNFSPSAISPDGRFLLFGVQNAAGEFLLAIFATENEEMIHTEKLSAKLVQPYVDQNSQRLIAIDANGNGFIFAADDPTHAKKTLSFSQSVTHYATVWLDRRLLVLGKRLQLFDLTSDELLENLPLDSPAIALFVSGDSKMALVGMRAAQMDGFDSKAQILQPAPLTGIQAARMIVMGASNTLCH